MAEIRLEDINKRFGSVRAVIDFSLTIADGEFMTIVGPSGCGKSTILNIIAGLEEPASGHIYFDGQKVNDLTPRERDVAMVFQSYALYPHKTTFENIAFPLRMARMKKEEIRGRVIDTAKLLGISDLLSRKPRELSGGQRQRVALGRAIVRRPKAFLLDEPLSNLDAGLRVQMRAELKRLHAELGATFIYVTHDQAEAMTLSDRVAVVNKGRLQQCGTPQEVYNFPLNIFVATFLGSPRMNLIPAHLERRDGAHLILPFTTIPLGEARLKLIEERGPSALIAGIRPEHVTVAGERGGIRARIAVTEPMGDHCIVHLEAGGITLTGKAPGDFSIPPGGSILFQIDWDKIHIFDKSSGERVA